MHIQNDTISLDEALPANCQLDDFAVYLICHFRNVGGMKYLEVISESVLLVLECIKH